MSWTKACFTSFLERTNSNDDTILLIDDNAVQAATRQTILKRAGYFVIAALNPARALEQVQKGECPTEVRLVITDHLMPGMSGAEFVRELRKTHPSLPVLVISGLGEAEAEYEGLGVVFRQKPLLPDNLLACVHGFGSAVNSENGFKARPVGRSVNDNLLLFWAAIERMMPREHATASYAGVWKFYAAPGAGFEHLHAGNGWNCALAH